MTDPSTLTVSTPRRATKMASNQNLNHLLNFTLPPRQTHVPTSLPRRSRKTGTHQGVWNKERFVNAQYRFVMNPTGDYTVHFADPDIFFQWNDILQVIIPRSSALASVAGEKDASQEEGHTTCPICLSPPTAPRMTKCGHVYCFPCILHYLSTSENKWARCPICFDSVNAQQLKSVKWYDGSNEVIEEFEGPRASSSSSTSTKPTGIPRVGSMMLMRLIQRPQITTLSLPRSHTWPSDLLAPHQAPFHFLPDVYNYSKFMLATPAHLISDLTKDLDELAIERRTLERMNDTIGLIFVEAAELKLRNQIAKANALDTPILRDAIDKAMRDLQEIQQRTAHQEQRRKEEEQAHAPPPSVPEEFLATKLGGVGLQVTTKPFTPQGNSDSPPNRPNPKPRRNLNPPPPSTSTYYFYQGSSGLPLFLHPLDIKILFSHFDNSYASFPDTITFRVEAFSEGTVNDDLRKRCKYLGHMPEGADVVFVEADLESVVGAEGIRPFEGALKMRRGRRRDKGRKDDRAKARAEEREREKVGLDREAMSWHVPSVPHAQVWTEVNFPLDNGEGVLSSSPSLSSPPIQTATRSEPVTGAWGSRSFASTAQAVAAAPVRLRNPATRPNLQIEDEYDMDVAWHELEQRSGGGGGIGRKKRGAKMVVLGGGGGRRR